MAISREELIDRLKRAYEMEEVMAGMLLGLLESEAALVEVPDDQRPKITEKILAIQQDTFRHRKIVTSLIGKVSEGKYGA